MVYLNNHLIYDILYVSTVPYDRLYELGYVCNMIIAFNLNLGDKFMIISRERDYGTGIGNKGFHMVEFPTTTKIPLLVLVMVTIWFMQINRPK